ncbi:MAG: transposase [Nitrosomonas sp.]|nr:transposase [Nitrosomonas sp.]
MVSDREEHGDEANTQSAMRVTEVTQPGVDAEARWVIKGGNSVLGYKQHAVVDNHGLVLAVKTTAANCHDSKPRLDLLDKAYSSQKHRDALKSRGIKTGIQNKATKNNPLTRRRLQLQCNRMITKARYVVERVFGSQARWFNATILRY